MPGRARAVLLLAAPLLVAGLAGCGSIAAPPVATVAPSGGDGGGGSAPSAAPAGSIAKACELLTLEEAQAIVGTTLSPGVEGPASDPSCSYEPDPGAGRTAQVRVITGEDATNTYRLDHDQLEHRFTDVPGVGDEAHQEDSAIFFRAGSTWAGITVVTLEDVSTVVRPLQDAARTVVSRLP
jgi:hypothetical protein